MKIACQAGTSITTMVGDLSGFKSPIWYTPNGIANVLSLLSVRKMYRVRYVSDTNIPYFAVDRRQNIEVYRVNKRTLLLRYGTGQRKTSGSCVGFNSETTTRRIHKQRVSCGEIGTTDTGGIFHLLPPRRRQQRIPKLSHNKAFSAPEW